MSSLRARLIAALVGAVLASGIVASVATYYSARGEINALLDEELRQVALSVRDYALLDLAPLAPPPEVDPQHRVIVQIWDPAGRVVYLSNTAAPLPLSARTGFVTLSHQGREWRMFTALAGVRVVQTAQPTSVRTELAAASALRLLVPILAVLPFLALLVWVILDRGLAPLSRLTRAVGARNPSSLEPFPVAGLPDEIRPLVESLNDLLARLGDALAIQRRFAADAAHELRTPLTALTLQIQLAERAQSDDDRAAAFAKLRDGVKRSSRLIQQLLTMARLEPEAAGRLAAPVALDVLAQSVVGELEPVAREKQVALAFGRFDPVRTTGYEDALRLLATNLVDNAIRYTPAGGRIEVRAFASGAEALLEVADDGPGIPPEERARVFDRFFRGAAGADVSGSGLGLAIVKQVADLHRGRVELADGLGGRGLTVRVHLPLSTARS